MALWERDLKNIHRTNPKLTAFDKIPRDLRSAHGTVQFTYREEGDSQGAKLTIDKSGRFQIYSNDGRLIAQGGFRDADGDGAFDIAKPGQTLV